MKNRAKRSPEFIRKILFYALLEGFVGTILLEDTSNSEDSDFERICREVISLCKVIQKKIPGHIDNRDIMLCDKLLKRFTENHFNGTTYIAVISFFLEELTDTVEYKGIDKKDKNRTGEYNRLHSLLSVMSEILEDAYKEYHNVTDEYMLKQFEVGGNLRKLFSKMFVSRDTMLKYCK